MGEICLQCGDIGHKKELIYCFKCTKSGRHSYCMDEFLPKSKHKTFRWLCDECQFSSGSSSIHNSNNNNNEFVNPGPSRAEEKEEEPVVVYAEPMILSEAEEKEEEPVVVYAEPMILSVWAGTFHMTPNDGSSTERMDGVHAFLSSKACTKVRETFDLFGDVLRLKVVARRDVWPKSFVEGMGPTDDHIGVFFFPLLRKQEEYNRLVWDMIRGDLAMRSYVPGDAQLLVFPSTELPQPAWRFQGRLYLWGVFKGKLPLEPLPS